MSKLAKKPIPIPHNVEITVNDAEAVVKGPKGTLKMPLRHTANVAIRREGQNLFVDRITENREGRMYQGLCFALLKNMVIGVTEGYTRVLEIVGVGYSAQLQGDKLVLKLGFSHPYTFVLPPGIKAAVDGKGMEITITGNDKYLVGETAANIRAIKPPEPYKGTGIKYKDERIIRKLGKAALAGAGAGAKK